MTLKATDKRIGCVVDAGNNVALRWEGERNVLVGRLSAGVLYGQGDGE